MCVHAINHLRPVKAKDASVFGWGAPVGLVAEVVVVSDVGDDQAAEPEGIDGTVAIGHDAGPGDREPVMPEAQVFPAESIAMDCTNALVPELLPRVK